MKLNPTSTATYPEDDGRAQAPVPRTATPPLRPRRSDSVPPRTEPCGEEPVGGRRSLQQNDRFMNICMYVTQFKNMNVDSYADRTAFPLTFKEVSLDGITHELPVHAEGFVNTEQAV